jgi:hypothetical protein
MGYAEVALSICQHQSCHTIKFQYHQINGTQMQARAQVNQTTDVLSYQGKTIAWIPLPTFTCHAFKQLNYEQSPRQEKQQHKQV